MRKTNQLLLALLLMAVGAMNVNAQEEEISLDEIPFWAHEGGWGIEELMQTPAEFIWVVNESTGQPYGDAAVNAFADLTQYTKLIVTATAGTPRIMLNRDIDEGQPNANEADAHLIQNTTGGWNDKYFTVEETDDGTVYTVDLKQIVKDKGYAHLHAIKSGSWGAEVTVTSMVVVSSGKTNGAEFSNDVIEVYFDFDTNIPDMVAVSGAKRVFFDKSCASVLVNGEEKSLYSVEGFEDGRFYIFMDEAIDDDATVEVSVTNSIGLVYTTGPNKGKAVEDFYAIATWNGDIEENEGMPYDYVKPTVMKTDPDDGSFNLPNALTITVTFDKNVDCAQLEATANGRSLTKSPADGFAKEIKLSGQLANGECVIKITKAYAEKFVDEGYYCDYEFNISVGKVTADELPYDVIPASYFTSCAVNSVPEGFRLFADGQEERTSGGNYGSGNRMMEFGTGGDFTRGLYMRTWHLEYGDLDDEHLVTLKGGKKYTTTFNSCMWNSGGTYMKFEVSLDDEPVFEKVITNAPNVNESRNAVSGTTASNISFVAPSDGNYMVRWYVAKDAQGTPTEDQWSNGVILANVKMIFMPDVPGYEYIMMLNNALDAANAALEANSDDRYQGTAFRNLQSLVNQYTGWEATSPNAYKEAVVALESAVQALADHRKNCNGYDEQIKKAIDVVRQNRENKFSTSDLYKEVVDLVGKYHGTSEWRNVSEDPETENWQLFYEYDMLTDDDALLTAISELQEIANLTSLLFTEGESSNTNTGVKVLVERIRSGAEALKALPGISENDMDVLAGFNAMEDDDALAEKLKTRIMRKVSTELANPETTLFQEVEDPTTLETTTNPVDMTVFVKNPNIYALHYSDGVTEENVPGWTVTGASGLWCGWNNSAKNIPGIAEDCAFTIYHNEGVMEQTITDLLPGVYTVIINAARWDDVEPSGMTFAYIKTAYTEEGEYDETQDLAYYGQYVMEHDNEFKDVVITDGYLTLGVNFASDEGQYFFSKVKLLMTAPAPGQTYEKYPEPGDVNFDGAVDVADISSIISVMAGTAETEYADANGDGVVDVADISYVITIMANAARKAAGIIGE